MSDRVFPRSANIVFRRLYDDALEIVGKGLGVKTQVFDIVIIGTEIIVKRSFGQILEESSLPHFLVGLVVTAKDDFEYSLCYYDFGDGDVAAD